MPILGSFFNLVSFWLSHPWKITYRELSLVIIAEFHSEMQASFIITVFLIPAQILTFLYFSTLEQLWIFVQINITGWSVKSL